jgi:Sec-independent protein translocase protein TatA
MEFGRTIARTLSSTRNRMSADKDRGIRRQKQKRAKDNKAAAKTQRPGTSAPAAPPKAAAKGTAKGAAKAGA